MIRQRIADHRVKHRALAAGQCRGIVHRLGRADTAPAANEAPTVGLVGKRAGLRVMHGHQVKHPGHRFFARAGSTRAENGPAGFDDLGLHEEIAERRMQCVGGGGRQHHLRVTRDLNRPARARNGW